MHKFTATDDEGCKITLHGAKTIPGAKRMATKKGRTHFKVEEPGGFITNYYYICGRWTTTDNRVAAGCSLEALYAHL